MVKGSQTAAYPYEIEYKGKTIRCRTLTDMQQALDELESGRFVRENTPWTEEEFQKFTGRVYLAQRRLLAALLKIGPGSWLEDSKLRELLDIADNQALAGTMSGISKVAQMFGIEPRRVLTIDTFYQHSKPRHRYQIIAGFAQAAAKHKWPSKDDLKENQE